MPGDIQTEPSTKMVFNSPDSEKNRYNFRLTNLGGKRMGWAVKTTNMARIFIDPPCGCLDAKEAVSFTRRHPKFMSVCFVLFSAFQQVMMTIAIEPFDYASASTANDRFTIEWTDAPEGAAKKFQREWFQSDGIVRRKNIPLEYNY
ncbi:MAG: motile sperm domain-containing protein [Gammaproteobacteria bacterium]|nr:motile sperm domain-containing protein [Gammaproteobacteria bacterium]